jgi:transcriptional regulator with XRE-family HTH domain
LSTDQVLSTGQALPGDRVLSDDPAADATVAHSVRQWRRRAGLSLEQAGRLLGVAHTTVRDWEAGRVPRDIHRHRLALIIGEAALADADATPLRRLRSAREVPLKQLARRLSVSSSTLSSWERGSRQAHPVQLQRIAQLLQLSAHEVRQLALFHTGADLTERSPDGNRRPTRLARLRRERGLSRTVAARRLGLSVSTLSRCESGERAVAVDLCVRMAAVYRCGFADVARAAGLELDPLLDRRTWGRATLPEVLAALRRARGVSAAAIARQLAVAPRTWRRWETGACAPRPQALRALEHYFGLPPRELHLVGSRER